MLLTDLQETDPVFCQSLQWILDNNLSTEIDDEGESGQDIVVGDQVDLQEDDSGCNFHFVTTKAGFGAVETVELIPDGQRIAVIDDNKDLYVSLRLHWHVYGCIADQVSSLQRGFFEVIPQKRVSVFEPKELALLLNGKITVDIEEMRECTRYTGGYTSTSNTISAFWCAFEVWTQAERRLVLKFATGSSRVPLDGFDPAFTITRSCSASGASALPTAHTCFNQLVLPPYENVDELQQKIMLAVSNAGGFELA